MSKDFPRDFETVEEYRRRMATEDQAEQPEETPVKAEAPPGPFVVDRGIYTSRADRDAIQAEQDRWTRLERMGR